jgi:hypothetical protein
MRRFYDLEQSGRSVKRRFSDQGQCLIGGMKIFSRLEQSRRSSMMRSNIRNSDEETR